MTFYEAAVEVLRRSGRPLHFKKITEVAIRDELLSHVGKTPEVTMEDRLSQETKKDDASWIVKTRPGVYTLKADIIERLNEEAKAREEAERAKREAAEKAAKAEAEARKADVEEEEEEEVDDVEEEEEDEEVEEEDDDQDEVEAREPDSDDESDNDQRGGRRRRRRRRRGGRDSKSGSKDSSKDSSNDSSESSSSRSDSNDESKSSRSRRGRRGGRNRNKKSSGRKKSNQQPRAASFDGLDDQRFDSIADAAFAVLAASGRKAMTSADVADVVFDKKLVRFHTHDAEATIQSAIATDNQVRERQGRRPLFAQYREDRWGLTEWGVSDEGIEKEQEILGLAEDLRSEALQELGEAVASLKAEAFEMVVMTLLERLYYKNLKVSKRTSDGDVFFTADWQRGFSDMRVCIHIVADSKASLQKEAIVELRETLEHYSASEGIVIHLGPVSKEAVRESRDEDKAKVTVIDRKTFVKLLCDEGIGVKTFHVPLVMVDRSFVDALQ